MATNEVAHGPVSRRVVENVKRLRAERGWSLARLSEALTAAGRPILATGLNRLEAGRRRIDVDDLIGLALALDVSPSTLLLPPTVEGDIELTSAVAVHADVAWSWVRAQGPLDERDDPDGHARLEFQQRALPRPLRAFVALDTPAGRRWLDDEAARKRDDPEYAAGAEHPAWRRARQQQQEDR